MIKRFTNKQFHYENINELSTHVQSYLLYYNYQKKIIKLKYITPYDKIIEYYDLDSSKFNFNPTLNPMKLNK